MAAFDTSAIRHEHRALLYRDVDEYAAEACRFIEAGDAAGERVLVAAEPQDLELLRDALGASAGHVEMLDISALARNPIRLIPAIREWLEQASEHGARTRVIGTPSLSEAGSREQVELIRHEALVNLAFSGSPVSLLCPYDVSALGDELLAGVECTHPELIRAGEPVPSARYTEPIEVWRAERWPLPEPETDPVQMTIGQDLAAVRRFVVDHGRGAGIAERRLADLVLAVDEAATNAVIHGRPPATLRIWRSRSRLVCEVSDRGHLADPLAGRRRPEPSWPDGRGLWLIGQLCDLVELRPLPVGTTIRLHLEIDG